MLTIALRAVLILVVLFLGMVVALFLRVLWILP